ncbi:hypothetical protein RHGRI_009956 [Rhododendron griersonianum]|uniref:non-specific serine/threonine protein kinase n=1 Tax=Rhododendron griersonianum TaxID=479676 RepID=A0AAV6KGR1_9ERIC|nr:hypothetical protein RHGRI_009956 [Rhododendron griersonianum]
MFRSKLGLSLSLSIISLCLTTVEPTCSKGCDLALGSYYVWTDAEVGIIAEVSGNSVNEIINYNYPAVPNEHYIMSYTRVVVPFPCDCIYGEFLAHVFTYKVRSGPSGGNTYDTIAETYYANLTTAATLERTNSYRASPLQDNAGVNVTVNCSCGNASVSEDYGLFVTYPLRPEDSLKSIAANASLVEPTCSKGCDLALGSYYVWAGVEVKVIAEVSGNSVGDIISYNHQAIPNENFVLAGIRIDVPFPCDCIDGEFLGHVFTYAVRSGGNTYDTIAEKYYSNLTTAATLERTNSYRASPLPDNTVVNVTVNCSCGNASVSEAYGLFVTYPLRPEDSLKSIAANASLDKSGSYRPLKSSTAGLSGGVIAGISIGVVMGALLVSVCIYCGFCRKKKVPDKLMSSKRYEDRQAPGSTLEKSDSIGAIRVDKSVEFSYEELAKATNDFSIGHKIGQGGFGAVYYAELRGEKAAIKKMDMMATREFLAELKVLTHVHHLNLVRLIGYCVEGSLFLVYEYIENGNLSQHLHGTGWDPLPWSTRVQIALDSARGLEYIHEHTVPVYIHRDIKTANILIDKNFRAKVADFGLAKLTEVGGSSLPTRLVGTFGYMPPEYAQYGDVSPKIDVYAFGVVLYELISAKEAIVKAGSSMLESKGLVALFEDVLNQPDPREELCKLVDPRLGDGYPIDSVRKLAQLAKACTQENPLLRPSMRSAVVALMTLSSSTEDWDVGSFYENQALVSLMSGR